MGLGVSGKVPELSFEESAGFFLPGNIVGGGSWKILVGSFIPRKILCLGVALKAGSSQLEGARGTAGKWRFVQNIKPVGAQTVRLEPKARRAAPGRRDGKHVHWECDVEVGVGKADVHWPHACLGTESG